MPPSQACFGVTTVVALAAACQRVKVARAASIGTDHLLVSTLTHIEGASGIWMSLRRALRHWERPTASGRIELDEATGSLAPVTVEVDRTLREATWRSSRFVRGRPVLPHRGIQESAPHCGRLSRGRAPPASATRVHEVSWRRYLLIHMVGHVS